MPRPGSIVSSRSLKSAARWRGSRLGRAVPSADLLDPAVDAVKGEIEPPRPRSLARQAGGRDPRRAARWRAPDRRDRQSARRSSTAPAGSALRPMATAAPADHRAPDRGARHALAEPARQRIARHRIEIADPLQADPPQPLGGGRVEAQGLHRQRGESGAKLSRRQDAGPCRSLRAKRAMAQAAPSVSAIGDASCDALALEPGREIGGERPFPAPEMGRAGDLDPDPVRRRRERSTGCSGRTIRPAGAVRRRPPRARPAAVARPGRKESASASGIPGARPAAVAAGLTAARRPPSGSVDDRGKRRLFSRRAGISPAVRHGAAGRSASAAARDT